MKQASASLLSDHHLGKSPEEINKRSVALPSDNLDPSVQFKVCSSTLAPAYQLPERCGLSNGPEMTDTSEEVNI